MLLQRKVETFCSDDSEYCVYAITNNNHPSADFADLGDEDCPGLKIMLGGLEYDDWVERIWRHIDFLGRSDGVTPKDSPQGILIREILFGLLSEGESSLGGWTFTSISYHGEANIIYISLFNANIAKQTTFMSQRESDIEREIGVHFDFTSNLPEDTYDLAFKVLDGEMPITFIVFPYKADNCTYELTLSSETLKVREAAPNYKRTIDFGRPVEQDDGLMIYKADVAEAFLH